MSQFWSSLLVWGLLWGGLFLLLEFWAVTEWPCAPPWNTLSWTIWQLSARSGYLAMAIAAGMVILTLHFVLPGHWPRRPKGMGWQEKDEKEGKR